MQLNIIKEVRDINRLKQILAVLFEEGFDFLLVKIKLKHQIPVIKRLKPKKSTEQKPEIILRKVLEKLGPTFIKFGQLLSVRPDLVPKEYCKELENLQDNVPPFSFTEARSIVEKELGRRIEDVFLKFEEKPIASASISQVYKAVLKNGKMAAVKVQRPNVRHTMETDIEIMFYVAGLLEKHAENMRRFKPVKIVSEFREWTEKELDFRMEARNAKRFHENFRGSKTVHIPKVYDEFSTEKVLTMEFIEGVELHNISEIKKRGIDFNKVIRNGFDAIMTQVFVHGIFHADPHPGNIIVMRDNSIAFVDFGIVGYFDEKLRNHYIDLLYGIVEQDENFVIETLLDMGMESDVNYEELRADIGTVLQSLQKSSIKDVRVSRVLEEILDIAIKHKLRVPASSVLFGKTILTLEGVALEYDPDFRLVETTRPFIEKLILQRKNPLYAWKHVVRNMHRYRRLAESFPEKAERILGRLESGAIKVDINDTDIKKLSLEIDRSSNRVAYGLLIAALLITSAILMQVEKGPSVLGVPLLSFFSFIIASIFALMLFISIFMERFR